MSPLLGCIGSRGLQQSFIDLPDKVGLWAHVPSALSAWQSGHKRLGSKGAILSVATIIGPAPPPTPARPKHGSTRIVHVMHVLGPLSACASASGDLQNLQDPAVWMIKASFVHAFGAVDSSVGEVLGTIRTWNTVGVYAKGR